MTDDERRSMIELVCLDMAGTTVADDGTVIAAFRSAIEAAGLADGSAEHSSALDFAAETMGQSKIEVFTAIFDGDATRAAAANTAFEASYAEGLVAGASAVPGAEEAIRRMRDRGTRVALTTGFSARTRDALLAALGWQELCDLVLSPGDAGRGRPYPDMVLTAVLRLGIDDVRSVAVAGDTTSDLLAGSRAGAGIVAGVLTGAHRETDFATVPHTHVLPSVVELDQLLAADADTRTAA
ncbi:phosphonatase-like hydrolase [Kribbella sp. CA-293567]|uniref:phosphonatase-like hydrolase n=1 Tax=Kribbella sp. CA-293567 TaxID=3002436 RepID=UPI0022DCE450|nr:phosphonatase-like hydrolase [Kribbella sp. CA-293567]WBQ04420.1 phosphonatase-like hydrolase [Kribbella sp. CA-293567]